MKRLKFFLTGIVAFLFSCSSGIIKEQEDLQKKLIYPQEKYFSNMIQLTFLGNNAEAYFSFDDKKITFQSDWNYETQSQAGCDQIFVIDLEGFRFGKPFQPEYKRISTGAGRTTCSFFLADGKILYSSTHEISPDCPKPTRYHNNKYVWDLFDYDIYLYDPATKQTTKLVGNKGYDAEGVISPDGRYLVYTSIKSGDIDIWRKDLVTGEELQLTKELGYDGGAFFSRDSKKIVWRAHRPKTKEEIQEYRELLKKNLVKPSELNIYIMDIDGKNKKQVTFLPGANWAPFFHPDGTKIVFSSNHHTLQNGGRVFNIFMVSIDGTNLEQITFGEEFEAFPFFSFHKHNGSYWFLFSSNRNNTRPRDTNVFMAEWKER